MSRLLLSMVFATVLARAQAPVTELLEQKTLARLRSFADSADAVIGVAAIDLTTGRVLSLNGDTVFPQASAIKIAILVELFRSGRHAMSERVTLSPQEAVGGSGRLQEKLKKGPLTLSLRELIAAMIEWSDNTATNKCIDLAGMDQVNVAMDSLGLKKTRLRRKMMDLAAATRNEENVSTPLEMARLVETIYRGKAAPPEACREMIEILKLPSADMRSAVPDGVAVASKPGQLDGVRTETGIVFLPGRPFTLSVASAYLTSRRSPVIGVTDIVFDHFDRLARSNAFGRFVK